ncbi:MAG: chromosome segregation protein SMC [Dehalococcoidales bacterium]|nr:chromosome segregation protein SMC [Dehalococcoidales bacterium]
MRLKRLEIRGFKTFASPVTLEFNSPITAVVGPNGSGKSNIADAVRWVLGEQSARALRTKKTEDVIFAGGSGRAQLGMAEVTLTLDNETGWLDMPYAEVAITRRAYRSGENEYLLNGGRVRLRDLNDMLLRANAGTNSYTSIGQGMVDLVLSLRPEERRYLFEEAADVKRHYLKIKESQDKLAATEDNMRRVTDLATELAPRVATLERQAERARRYAALSAELQGLLVRWYRHQWRRAQVQLTKAEEEDHRAAADLRALEEELATAEEQAATLASRRTNMERRRSALAAEAATLAQQIDRVQLEIAVGRERLAALADRGAEIERRLGETAQGQERGAAQLTTSDRTRAGLAAEKERLAADLAQVAADAAQAHGRREARTAELAAVEAALEQVTNRWTQAQVALARQAEQRTAAAHDIESRRKALRDNEGRLLEIEQEVAAVNGQLAKLDQELDALAHDLAAKESALAEAENAVAGEEQRLEHVRRERQALAARLAVLERWHQDLSGYHGGVRAVLRAGRGGQRTDRLEGIVGVVAGLLRVPPELEVAVEVALGGRLQDVVVERWRDAEAAIEFLKRTRAGRATFLPLDTLRQGPSSCPVRGPGVLGVGSDLVEYAPAHAVVARHLLGRTLVVQDLPTARRALADCPGGWQIVTLAGEIVRSSGAVTGGTLGPQQSGLLGQERELRDGPARLAALDGQVVKAEHVVAERRAAIRDLKTSAGQLLRQEREHAVPKQRAEADLATRLREAERRRRELAGAEQAVQAAEEAWLVAGEREEELSAEQERLARAREAARGKVEEAREALAALDAADGDLTRRLAEGRAALANVEREEARLARLHAEQQAELRRLAAATAQLQQEAGQIEEQSVALAEALAADEAKARGLAEQHEQNQATERDLREGLARLQAQTAQLEASRHDLHRRQTALSAACATATAAVERVQGELASLRERIGGDLGLEDDEGRRQLPLPWEAEAPEVAEETLSPEQLRRQIDHLRSQLRGLANVNPEAVHDHAELAARHSYLLSQHADLQQAARGLRLAIADLEQAMRRQFEKTVAEVAGEFRRNFTALFGGGTARLVLTEGDNPLQTGVEIIAQPPGKRLQSLTLLSGGERALTAVALIFAILRVKPAPFCVLDEIDAALDDANVRRCAAMLASLADQTQFVVITHNRGTMEHAGTLYGVSIGPDGVSRLVSLRLENVPPADDEDGESGLTPDQDIGEEEESVTIG